MPYISVHIDDEDIRDCLDDMTDKELAAWGFCRISTGSDAGMRGTGIWHEVRLAMRQRDERRMADLLAQLAWDQAGVILPDGLPPVH